jgi:VCBS repeat-containing protein
VKFGLVKLAIPTPGTYKIDIKPSGKVLAALKKGKTLAVRITVVFTPAGTTTQLTKVSAVRLQIKRRKHKPAGA